MLVFVGLRMNQTEAFLFLIIVAMVGLVLSMECECEGAILDNIRITICMYISMIKWKVNIYICIYIYTWCTYMTWVQVFDSLLAMMSWVEKSAARSSGTPTMANLLSDAEHCMEQLPVLLKGHLDLQVFETTMGVGRCFRSTWYQKISNSL